jgi:tRNA(Ile)-lysidine synthase
VARVQRCLRLSPEEAARRVRYAFFNKIMIDENYNKLALGHLADDNAEQILMALLRGAGSRGLSGIAPVRDGRIVRPLIAARRMAIDAFLRQEDIVSRCDATNADLRFGRNRIRHQLLPLLAAEYNPRIVDQLNRVADLLRRDERWMDAMAATHFQQLQLARDRGRLTLSTTALTDVPAALARRLVRQALAELAGGLRRISFTHIQAVLHLSVGRGGEKECHLPGGIRVRRVGEQLTFWVEAGARRKMRGRPVTPPPAPGTIISGPFPRRVEIEAMGVGLHLFPCRPDRVPGWERVDRKRAYFDLEQLRLPLQVRPVQPGDRFTPLGAAGSQKVKKFFIDHHVPRHVRARCPVLADGRGIVWLMGHRMGDEAKVTPLTSHVLGVEYFLLDTR